MAPTLPERTGAAETLPRIPTTPAAAAAAYLEDRERRKASARTLQAYRLTLHGLCRALDAEGVLRIQDVTPGHIGTYASAMRHRGCSPATVYQYVSRLDAFFKWLADRRWVLISPCEDTPRPRTGHPLQPVPSESDMTALLAQPDPASPAGMRDRALLEVAYATACRMSELLDMDIGDCDLSRGVARVTGKGKTRIVPLGTGGLVWLKRYLERARPRLAVNPSGPPALWLGTRGRRLNPLIFERAVSRYGRQAGIEQPVTPHSLRRACATHMLRRGAHPVQIQHLLGHASLKTLSRYLRVGIADLKAAHRASRPGQ